MSPGSELRMLEKRLTAFRRTLQGASETRKKDHVSLAIATQFNEMLEGAQEVLPDVKNGLPKPAPTRGFGSQMGLVPMSYLDLEILVDQVLAMIELAQESED